MTRTVNKTISKPSMLAAALAICTSLTPLAGTSSSFAMETNITNESVINKGNLSPEFQKSLTNCGYVLLEKIYSGKKIDLLSTDLFQEIMEHGKKISNTYGVSDYVYAAIDCTLPTSWMHWYSASQNEEFNTKRENQMMGIVAITWALADLSAKQGDSFERGSFTILDHQHCLYNFMLDYVNLANNKEVRFSWLGDTLNDNFNSYAYRTSPSLQTPRNLNDHSIESQQFGIDVRFAPHKNPLQFCPYNNAHLIFVKLELETEGQKAPLLCLKWEPTGRPINAKQIITDSVKSTANFAMDKVYGSPTIRSESEAILPNIQESFSALKQAADFKGDYKTIRSMMLKAETVLVEENLEQAAKEASLSFINLVNLTYRNGFNHLRSANEVILDPSK